jgi:hypothetical protein
MQPAKPSITHLFALLALILTATVSTAHTVKNDYSPSVDFTQYRTFRWIKEPDCVNACLKREIMDDINTQLESKGLYPATNIGDLAVSANIAAGERYTLKEFYECFPSDWNWQHYLGPGSSTKFIDMYKEDANTYKPGTLVVDLFDVNQKRIVWWGVADKFVYEVAPEGPKQVMEAFVQMFSGNFWWTTMP